MKALFKIIRPFIIPIIVTLIVVLLFHYIFMFGYRGRSMSTSDVVWAEGLGTFFCDSIGFKPIKFNQKKCPWRKFDG